MSPANFRTFLTLFCLGSALLTGGRALGQEPTRLISSADVQLLRTIEARVLAPTLQEGPAHHGDLLEYFLASNQDLHARMMGARVAFAKSQQRPYRKMTIVSGPAGVGKTFVKGQVYEDIPKHLRWKFDVRDLFAEFIESGLAELRPDLRCDAVVFNRLPALTPQGRQAFAKHFREQIKPFVVVDSIDEVHPDDYEFILHELEHATLDESATFIHLVVFGRPLAFRKYWLENLSSGLRHEIQKFVLQKPRFHSTGDLTVSNWNYDCWKHSLCRETDGRQTPLMLRDYQKWVQNGYGCIGPFCDVTFVKNDHIGKQQRMLLNDWAIRHRVVASVLPNLAANEMVRNISIDFHLQNKTFNEREFMESFFQAWLERDTKSDDRPSRRKPEHLKEYLRLLENVATSVLVEGGVDSRGYFSVPSTRTVSTTQCQTPIPVIRVLNRSGLVSVDPTEPLAQRFRFEPFWFHRYLVERNRDRQTELVQTLSPQNANENL